MRQVSPAGRRNQRIRIEQATKAPDAAGELVATWSLYAERWASVEPLSGRELWAARQVQAAVTHRIVLLYLEGVTPGMRILHGDKTYQIESAVNPESRNEELEILATEAPASEA